MMMKSGPFRRGLLALGILGALGCSPRREPLPPATPPLSRTALGYGVVSTPYVKMLDEPSGDGVSLGHVREGTILRVLERRIIREGEETRRWLLTEGDYQGWLPEEAITVYDNEDKARTAAGGIGG
jgi:hypothetical protein